MITVNIVSAMNLIMFSTLFISDGSMLCVIRNIPLYKFKIELNNNKIENSTSPSE